MKMFIFKGFLKVLAFIFIGGFVVMSLWNWLMPVLFGLKLITFLQALGLLVLSKILFGGFRGGGGWRGRHPGGGHMWKEKMAERWENMNPEERERFKKHWKGRFNWWKEERQ